MYKCDPILDSASTKNTHKCDAFYVTHVGEQQSDRNANKMENGHCVPFPMNSNISPQPFLVPDMISVSTDPL